MKRTLGWLVIVMILGGGLAGLYYWRKNQNPPVPPPGAAVPAAPPAIAEEPSPRYPIDTGPALVEESAKTLPSLESSDSTAQELLWTFLGKKIVDRYFYPDQVIRRIVATVDNLPRKEAPGRMMPVKPAPGSLLTVGNGEGAEISPANYARYASYMAMVEAVDARKVAAVYERYYPLFQRAYQELGYPKGYFNDRLVAAIDDLLATPEVEGSVKLTQPKVLFEYADPDLESRSAGQKIVMRIGNENAAKLKSKLREIRYEVTRHAHDADTP